MIVPSQKYTSGSECSQWFILSRFQPYVHFHLLTEFLFRCLCKPDFLRIKNLFLKHVNWAYDSRNSVRDQLSQKSVFLYFFLYMVYSRHPKLPRSKQKIPIYFIVFCNIILLSHSLFILLLLFDLFWNILEEEETFNSADF